MKAILEIDMPDTCMVCTLTNRGWCPVLDKDILDYYENKHGNCPLVEVKECKYEGERVN